MKQILVLSLLLLAIFARNNSGTKIQSTFDHQTDPFDKLAYDALLENINYQNMAAKFVKVLKCFKQVVAGTNYYLNVEFMSPDGSFSEFYVTINVKPWLNYAEVLEFERVKMHYLQEQSVEESESSEDMGQKKEIQFDEEEIEFQQPVISKLFEHFQKEVKVKQAFKQVVSGLLYELICDVQGQLYSIDVYMQPWNNFIDVQNVVKITE